MVNIAKYALMWSECRHFDEEGNYIAAKDEDEKDAWLESLDAPDAKIYQPKVNL